MVAEVVNVVAEDHYVGHEPLERVVDAAAGSHPDWVIVQCRREADSIMDQGKSMYYRRAVRWPGKAREVYVANGGSTVSSHP